MIDNLKDEIFRRTQVRLDAMSENVWDEVNSSSPSISIQTQMHFMEKGFYKEYGFANLTFLGEPVTTESLNEWLEALLLYKVYKNIDFIDLCGKSVLSDLRRICWWLDDTSDIQTRFVVSFACQTERVRNIYAKEYKYLNLIALVNDIHDDYKDIAKNIQVDLDQLPWISTGEVSFNSLFANLIILPELDETKANRFIDKQQAFLKTLPVQAEEEVKLEQPTPKKSWLERLFSV